MSRKSGKSRGLGRGLTALMADVTDAPAEGAPLQAAEKTLPIENLSPNPNQPRHQFDEEQLEELTNSVRKKGILQPLIVRRNPDGGYQIVAGERRWRAAQRAMLHEVPVIVRTVSDSEMLEIAIIENIQRADLNPIEEAAGYRQLMDRFGHTQEKLAEALGKSRSYIANLLRLLGLPDDVVVLVKSGALSAGHARALITSENSSELAKRVVKGGLSVRATEDLARKMAKPPPGTAVKPRQTPEKDADTRALEEDLGANLRMKVNLRHFPGQEAGRLTIEYKNLDQLDTICRLLSAT